jgi:hypothetical protein
MKCENLFKQHVNLEVHLNYVICMLYILNIGTHCINKTLDKLETSDLEALCGYWMVVNVIVSSRQRFGSCLPSTEDRNPIVRGMPSLLGHGCR